MERMERAVGKLGAEHLQRLPLRGSCKRKERKVLVLAVHNHFLQELVIPVNLVFCFAFDFGILTQSLLGVGQSGL